MGTVSASCAGGGGESSLQRHQINDLLNCWLSQLRLALGFPRIGQGLVLSGSESVERGPHGREVGSSASGRVNPIKDYLLLPSLVIGINRIGQELVSTLSG